MSDCRPPIGICISDIKFYKVFIKIEFRNQSFDQFRFTDGLKDLQDTLHLPRLLLHA